MIYFSEQDVSSRADCAKSETSGAMTVDTKNKLNKMLCLIQMNFTCFIFVIFKMLFLAVACHSTVMHTIYQQHCIGKY